MVLFKITKKDWDRIDWLELKKYLALQVPELQKRLRSFLGNNTDYDCLVFHDQHIVSGNKQECSRYLKTRIILVIFLKPEARPKRGIITPWFSMNCASFMTRHEVSYAIISALGIIRNKNLKILRDDLKYKKMPYFSCSIKVWDYEPFLIKEVI